MSTLGQALTADRDRLRRKADCWRKEAEFWREAHRRLGGHYLRVLSERDALRRELAQARAELAAAGADARARQAAFVRG